jgi:hypothetical protein
VSGYLVMQPDSYETPDNRLFLFTPDNNKPDEQQSV